MINLKNIFPRLCSFTLYFKGVFYMKKQILSALLAVCLTGSLVFPAWAAPASAPQSEAVQALSALGIMSGDESGNLNLNNPVTRGEFVTMLVRATPGSSQIGQAATSPYPDVPRSHWASGFVEAAVSMGLVSGYSDGTFRPEQRISLAEGITMALQLLGYGPQDFSGSYPTGQLSLYHSLKLDRGVLASGASDAMTRQDATYLFYNLLSASTKEGTPYITALGYSLNSAGQVDLLSLVNGEMEGPVVAGQGWQSALPFTPSKVIRAGASVSLSDIQDYDLVYWNASMGTVWAYTQKATGPIQALEPSSSSPTSVTVAGHSYPIETSAAAYALSDLGQYGLGDNVTLLLGRTGGVAAVADVSASAGERVGLVISVSNSTYPDGNGGTYTAQTVTMLATDGQTYQYQCRGGCQAGSVVRASVNQNNEVSIRALSPDSLEGKVSADGTKLDRYSFAEDVEILDVSGQYGAVLSPSRLAGVNLTRDMVRYYSLNSLGQIDTLILEEVTGDMYQYGVLTQMKEQGEGLFKYYTYMYDIGGTSYSIPNSSTRFWVTTGPMQILGDTANPDRMYSLTATESGQILGNQFAAGNRKYTISDQVVVYELRNSQYFLSSLGRAQNGDFTLTGWYDKEDSQGGRIRVIVAREN